MSNTTVKRRLTLYINGEEVGNNIKAIRARMQTLVNEQAKLTRGSKEYVAATQKIRSLKGIIQEHNNSLRSTEKRWLSLSSISDGFNRYSGMLIGLLGSMTGVVLGFRKCADEAGKFEENLDNLSALTGLEGKSLEWLGDQATAMSIKTTDAGIKIKQSATDILDAFTKMGSQRPDLLTDKEALRAVTEDAIILSEAAKMQLEPATASLANVMNQFSLESNESRRVINELAAGSKVGAGDIQYLSDAIEKCGTTSSLMGIQTNQAVGIIEAIAPKFKEASMAGNSLDKVLLKMKEKQIGYKDGVFDMNTALDELQTRFMRGETSAELFGVEHAKMAEVLVLTKNDVIKYTEAVTGTEIALEQAQKNTNNRVADRAQAMNKLKIQMREVGEKIAPSITIGTNAFTYFLNALSRAPQIYENNKTLIHALITAFIAYQGSAILATGATLKSKAASLLDAAAKMKHGLATKFAAAQTDQYNKVQGRLGPGLIKVRALFSMLWKTIVANPIGAIAIAIYGLIKAINYLESTSDSALKAEALRSGLIEKSEIATRLATKANEKYAESLEKINTMSVEDRSNTIDSLTKDIDKATKAYNDLRFENSQFVKSQAEVTKTQFLWITLKSGSSDKAFRNNLKKQEEQNLEEFKSSDKGSALEEQTNKLQEPIELLTQKRQLLIDINNLESDADKIITQTPAAFDEKIKKYEKALRISEAGSEASIRITQKLTDAKKLLSEMEKVTPSTTTDPQKEKKEAESKLLTEMEAIKKLSDTTIEAQQKLADTLRQIKEKQHLDTLSDSEKEIYEVNKKYAELLSTCHQFGLDSSEVLASYKTEFEQITFKLAPMDVGQLQEIKPVSESAGADIFGMTEDDWDTLEGKVSIALDLAGQLTGVWDSFNQIQANRENKELQDYEDSCNKKKDLLNKQLNSGRISQEQYNARTAALDSDLDKRKAEIAKKQAKRDKATAITNALINTASAIMRIWSDVPKVDFGISTGILTAVAAATGAAQIAVIASQPLPEFAKGGMTDGARMYIAGEAGQEWISPNWMLKDKRTAPMIERLEAVRTGIISPDHLIPNIPDFQTMTSIPMFASGGFTGSSVAGINNTYYQQNTTPDNPLWAVMSEDIKLLREHLSDPRNRQATISNDLLIQNNKETEAMNRLKRV